MSSLIVTQAVYDALRAHGDETYPHECCGALLGRPNGQGWSVTEAIRAGNTRTIRHTIGTILLPLSWSESRGAREIKGWKLRGSITRILIIRHSGPKPTLQKRTGSGVPT